MADVLAIVVIPDTPSPLLSPNARVHWARKAKQVGIARQLAKETTKASLTAAERVAIGQHAHIGYTVAISWEKGRRGFRDEDNALSSCKAFLDGVADALGIDDRRFRVRGVSMESTTRAGVTTITLMTEG